MGELDFLLKSDCPECSEELKPPPDTILGIPPPPPPSFLLLDSADDNSTCHHQCAWAPQTPGVEFVELTHRGPARDDTWFFVLGAACVGVLVLGGLLALLLLKFRSAATSKTTLQVASAIVATKGCDSVLYPYSPAPVPDGRVLWATLTPRGTTHHYAAPPSSRPDPPPPRPAKPRLPPPEPPVSFDNTGFVDSDSQSPLMESYQLNDLESDTASDGDQKRTHRPRVSTPTRIEHPNLPPLNLHPHRSLRRATVHRRNSDAPCPSPI